MHLVIRRTLPAIVLALAVAAFETARIPSFAQQSATTDTELARKYAPQLRLSGPGSTGVFLIGTNYPYIDYIPISVNDLTSRAPDNTIELDLTEDIQLGETLFVANRYPIPDGALDILGSPDVRSADNSLLFEPLWENRTTAQTSYKELSINPTVYFKVFRDELQNNPIAIQYWFFYFYHHGQLDHPGDWESITVFLDESEQAAEGAFLNHIGTTRVTWQNVEVYEDSHPVVYVANGGHGSYSQPGTTTYDSAVSGSESYTVYHQGDRQRLNPDDDYMLANLADIEASEGGWIWFEGRWGNNGTDIGTTETAAPFGPRFRTDISGTSQWNQTNYPPFNPYNGCQPRTEGVSLWGSTEDYGPWFWVSGYGLDQQWESQNDCTIIPPPLPPTDLSFSITDNVVTVRWDSSAGGNAYGYIVHFSDEPGGFTSSPLPGSGQNIGNTNKFSVELEEGTYYFALQAFDSLGRTSDFSSTLIVSFAPPSSLPAVPNVIRTGSTSSPGPSIRSTEPVLEWSSVVGSSRYQLEFYDETEDDLIIELLDHTSLVYSVPPLTVDHTYSWRVRACNINGCSNYSALHYFTIQSDPVSPPFLAYHNVVNSRVTIKWSNPDDIAGVKAFYGLNSGQYDGELDLGNISQVSAEVGAGTYYLSLKSYDTSGNLSPGTGEIKIVVPSTEALPQVPTVANPGSLSAPGPLINSIVPQLDWEIVPEADSYRVVLQDLVTEQYLLDIDSYTFTEIATPPLALGRDYLWMVQACNSAGCSDFSSPRYFRTVRFM